VALVAELVGSAGLSVPNAIPDPYSFSVSFLCLYAHLHHIFRCSLPLVTGLPLVFETILIPVLPPSMVAIQGYHDVETHQYNSLLKESALHCSLLKIYFTLLYCHSCSRPAMVESNQSSNKGRLEKYQQYIIYVAIDKIHFTSEKFKGKREIPIPPSGKNRT
jgi:hypothetical protein